MKIKLIQFFSSESTVSKQNILFLIIASGLSAGMLVFVINNVAYAVYNNSSNDLPYLLIFIIVAAIMYITKKEAFIRSILVTEELVRKIRVRLVDKIRHTELHFIEQKGSSELFNRLTQDINTLSQSIPVLVISLDALFTIFGIFIYCAFLSISSFLCILIFVLISLLFFFSKYIETKNQFSVADAEEHNYFEAINGLLTGFKQLKVNQKRNQSLYNDLKNMTHKTESLKAKGVFNIFKVAIYTDTLYFVMIGIFIFLLPLMFESNKIILPKLITAILFIYSPLSNIYKFAPHIVMSNLAIDKLDQLEIQLDESIRNDIQPSTIIRDFQNISLSSVVFHYIDKYNQSTFTLGPLDLSFHKGEVVFIAGGNGSGKSTLLKLLTGLYETNASGKILLNGESLTENTLSMYRQLFSIIFTDYHLFKKLYGIEKVDPSKIDNLLKEMLLETKTQFIDQHFTNIDLSTGQKKRLAYVVSILEDRPIYVFDEWAADQDPEFREYFYTTIIADLKKIGKTIIAVTHDDRYFDYADRLIKMDSGMIII
ncbi:peptide ABC transporter [Candidatus Magnetomorum sp. HK-1]|nr:peptide ABC transporter [Candidatus Magnetomorum sp. HK-1]